MFMALWGAGMAGSFSAGSCLKEHQSDERKLRHCTIAIDLPLVKSRSDYNEFSLLYLGRAIAFARLGRTSEAKEDFRRALVNASEAGQTFEDKRREAAMIALFARMEREDDASPAVELWLDLLEEV